MSGFLSSIDPAPQPIPNKAVIKRIVKGETDLYAKIYIESLKQRNLMYTVRITTVAGAPVNDPSWKTALQTYSLKKLVLSDLILLQDIYISVNASNTAGMGIFSDSIHYNVR